MLGASPDFSPLGPSKTTCGPQGVLYTTKPADQPWFDYRYHVAVEAKYSAWLRYTRNLTQRNKDLHRVACRRMVVTSMWAINSGRRTCDDN